MNKKDGRKCVFVDGTIHARLQAMILQKKLEALENGDPINEHSLQGLIDSVLADWLERHEERTMP